MAARHLSGLHEMFLIVLSRGFHEKRGESGTGVEPDAPLLGAGNTDTWRRTLTEHHVKRAMITAAISAAAILTLFAVGGLVAISRGPDARSLPVLLTSIEPADAAPSGSDVALSALFRDLPVPDTAAEIEPATAPPATTAAPSGFEPDKITPSVGRTVETSSTTRTTTGPALSAAGITTTSAKPATTTTLRPRETEERERSETDDREPDHEVILPEIRESDSAHRETHDDG